MHEERYAERQWPWESPVGAFNLLGLAFGGVAFAVGVHEGYLVPGIAGFAAFCIVFFAYALRSVEIQLSHSGLEIHTRFTKLRWPLGEFALEQPMPKRHGVSTWMHASGAGLWLAPSYGAGFRRGRPVIFRDLKSGAPILVYSRRPDRLRETFLRIGSAPGR